MGMAGLGLLGVIDGIHMRIIAPSQNKHIFVNKKRYHSNSVLFFSVQSTRFWTSLQDGQAQHMPPERFLKVA